MKEYHKINTIFKRDMEAKGHPLLFGQFSEPEYEVLQNIQWEWTEKIDGTNIRVVWLNQQLSFKGRTDNAIIPNHLLEQLNTLFTEELMMEHFPTTAVTLYGEGYGTKIQSGGNYINNGTSFILFDIQIAGWWLKRENCEGIAKNLNIDIVPVLGHGTLYEAIAKVQRGFKSTIAQNKEYEAEGLILKPKVDLFNRKGERIITKIKHRDFKI